MDQHKNKSVSKDHIRAFRHTLRKLERRLDDALDHNMNCCGVTLVQCHTLMELERAGETGLTELAGSLELDKSTVSRGVDLLVREKLVRRVVNKTNRRAVRISLTEKGREVCSTINDLSDRYYQELFAHIPEEKHRQVMESLALFSRALTALRQQAQPDCGAVICPKPPTRFK